MSRNTSSPAWTRETYVGEADAESSITSQLLPGTDEGLNAHDEEKEEDGGDTGFELEGDLNDGMGQGMDPQGFAGPKIVKPLSTEALAAYKAAQERAGVIYISRIPPGMRPSKVRHLMSSHGEVGRVYLQQEDAKRAYLRRKYTSTKKPHFTEGWVEFKDKKVARSVAEMLNAQPIGGKKGTRWRDDVWTMKYLPRFKWNMLTDQVAHEAAIHTAKLRVELSQSRSEQRDYMRNVELARVLEKRSQRKKAQGEEMVLKPLSRTNKRSSEVEGDVARKRFRDNEDGLNTVLGSIF
ncbi:hypothetical protein F5876DRAFT_88412 [Lentinula aff. lateritia]|uniref:Uncharacterized protein n=1 Tax=Lentinula aff. lateritia TaxID=2804960 RepID=A0ACC1U2L7_9AGAR|nr:hypothetical protein F5876DRAFT_88412 [Lentinula aff. lateritia]